MKKNINLKNKNKKKLRKLMHTIPPKFNINNVTQYSKIFKECLDLKTLRSVKKHPLLLSNINSRFDIIQKESHSITYKVFKGALPCPTKNLFSNNQELSNVFLNQWHCFIQNNQEDPMNSFEVYSSIINPKYYMKKTWLSEEDLNLKINFYLQQRAVSIEKFLNNEIAPENFEMWLAHKDESLTHLEKVINKSKIEELFFNSGLYKKNFYKGKISEEDTIFEDLN